MESVGKFEFNRKDLIGHGAFAVVFKGKHKEKRDVEVAVKCINRKNLAKSQSLLGKEINILKELKHENIVTLLDFQEISGCVYLIMEFCNGGDLADYLHAKGCLSERTVRSFLVQIAAAMAVLRIKGVVHRDLKPQNILLSHGGSCRSDPSNICIKLADFGFARYLQGNTMAATLCGSPLYMAPEVIMSQNYDAKADLWSVGTIIFQCLTGKAPFQASSPQELRLFYERTRKLRPNIPRETSRYLRHLLLGLLKRNYRDRMDFDEFFHHPFLDGRPAERASSPVPVPLYPNSGPESSSSGSSNSPLSPPTQVDAKPHEQQSRSNDTAPSGSQLQPRSNDTAPSGSRLQPRPNDTAPSGSQLKESSASEIEDFVMVTAQFSGEPGDCHAQDQDSVMQSGCSLLDPATCMHKTPPSLSPARPAECSGSSYSQSVAVPVPTQFHNYQRLAQNVQGAPRTTAPTSQCGKGASPGCVQTGGSPEAGCGLSHRRVSTGGSGPYQPCPEVAGIPEASDQAGSQGSSRTEQQDVRFYQPKQASPPFSNLGDTETPTPRRNSYQCSPDGHKRPLGRRASCTRIAGRALGPAPGHTRTMPELQGPHACPASTLLRRTGYIKRSVSTGRLSDMLLKVMFGGQPDRRNSADRLMDTTAPPGGGTRTLFTVDSPPKEHPPNRRLSVDSCCPGWTYGRFHKADSSPDNQRHGLADTGAADPREGVAFVPPELPEETLMEDHTDVLAHLRLTLAFSHSVMEMAATKDCGNESSEEPDASFLQQSLVADQISQLSREWSSAEQLVLYMKCAEMLSSALHTAMEAIKQNKLYTSASVKHVVRKLNEVYKECVRNCRALTARLQLFFSTKQRLMDRICSIAAEKLIYSHTVQMVQAAALDEMFHRGDDSAERYQKALLLMEGLSLIITERADLHNLNRCKKCIEQRLSSLQPGS
ncbi:serine/threonine-protein kinase ULK1a isoform X2 [Electrophorus electricus]|uniref:serine/threonine-protein kinase ULK1a isoform X2 n=1 Tax=Electrophorus electricus TaxID=8005 RepID=UPI0015D09F0F|nr:serine/threonine-protein kinase ULK1a isoform X2 [Electrophorus electricus]